MTRPAPAALRRAPRRAALVALALGAAPAACSEEHGTGLRELPTLVSVAVAPNALNTLSALVTYTAQRSDSARVRYWAESELPAQTPFFPTRSGGGTVPVLGLRAGSLYHATLEVRGPGGSTLSAPLEVQAGELPPALQGVRLDLAGQDTPPPGFLLTSVTLADTAFAVAFDRTGAIRWYRGFPTQAGEHALACEQQPNGNFTLFVGASSGWQPVAGRYFEFAPAGDSMATFTAGGALYTDPHEVLVRGAGDTGPDSVVYLLGYDLRSVDLTSLGGGPAQTVAGHSILRQSAGGTVEFQWSAWDHFMLDDWVARPANLSQTTQLDFDHANSIELDRAGDYLVSFAALTQVVKIDHRTGAIRWRLGGRRNQFRFVGDPLDGFGIQHDVRFLPNGHLLLFDNGNFHTPPESRAVEYALDTLAMTATLVWEARHSPPVFAPFVGSAQRFQNGHTLIGYGAAGVMTEVSAQGTMVWEGRLDVPGQSLTIFYRVRELPSLYAHQQP